MTTGDPWGHEVGEDNSSHVLDAAGHIRHHGDEEDARLLGAPTVLRPGVERLKRLLLVVAVLVLVAGAVFATRWALDTYVA